MFFQMTLVQLLAVHVGPQPSLTPVPGNPMPSSLCINVVVLGEILMGIEEINSLVFKCLERYKIFT